MKQRIENRKNRRVEKQSLSAHLGPVDIPPEPRTVARVRETVTTESINWDVVLTASINGPVSGGWFLRRFGSMDSAGLFAAGINTGLRLGRVPDVDS